MKGAQRCSYPRRKRTGAFGIEKISSACLQPRSVRFLTRLTVWDGTYIVSDYGPNFCRACIRYGNDLDELSVSNSFCLQCREERIHIDVPLCTEPSEGLRSDY